MMLALVVFGSSEIARGQASPPPGVHFQGQIIDTSGNPLVASSVIFTLQVTNPSGNCVLYEETQTLNMTGSNGVFDLVLGTGTVTSGSGSQNPSPSLSFTSIFSNAAPFSLLCGTYTPASGDSRLLKVSFNDSSQTVTLSTPYTITSVPYALYADSLQGHSASGFIQTNTATASLSQSNVENIFSSTNYPALVALLNGSSSKYVTSTTTGGAALPTSAGAPSAPAVGDIWYDTTTQTLEFYNGSVQTVGGGTGGGTVTSVSAGTGLSGGTITTSGTISMPNVGTPGTYPKVATDAQGRVTAGYSLSAADIPSLDASKISTGTFSSAQIPSDATKLSLSGGTMSGAIAMGGQNLTGTGYVTMSPGKYIGLGTFTNATESTLVSGTLNSGGATYSGVTWYNSDVNEIKYWNGSAVVAVATGSTAISSLNGLTTATQNFAIGTSGTAPAFSSAMSTHTLNIPMASTAGTTAGLIANTDYTSWVKADGTVAFSAAQSMGGFNLNNVLDPTSAQQAATKNYADLHIAGNAVNPSLSTIVSSSAGNGDLLTWDQSNNRWTASAPSTSGTVTSVGLTLPGIFSVTNSPVTSSGSLTASLANQSANTVFAGPSSGGAVAPTFRALVNNDLPNLTVAKGGTGSTSLTPDGLLLADSTGSTISATVCGNGATLVSNGTGYSCQVVATSSQATQWTTSGSNITYSTGSVGIGSSGAPTSLFETTDSSAKTASYTGILYNVSNTSSTASINKVGLDIESTGVWNGSSAVNTGLIVNATGGTTNYAATFSGGNVGVGTTTPATTLDVNGPVTMRQAYFENIGALGPLGCGSTNITGYTTNQYTLTACASGTTTMNIPTVTGWPSGTMSWTVTFFVTGQTASVFNVNYNSSAATVYWDKNSTASAGGNNYAGFTVPSGHTDMIQCQVINTGSVTTYCSVAAQY